MRTRIRTRRKRLATLRIGEPLYHTVVEDLTEVICRFKADGTFTFVNEVYCRFFGKTRKQLIGRKWQPRAVTEDVPLIEAQLRTLAPANPVVVIENRVHDANGEVRWMQFVNRGFFDAGGRLVEMQAVGRDNTERKRAEAALKQGEQRLQMALDAAELGTFDYDFLTGSLTWSERQKRIWGLAPDETPTYAATLARVHPEDQKRVTQLVTTVTAPTSSGIYETEYRIVWPDGSIHWNRVKGRVFFEGKGRNRRPVRWLGVERDLTARKQIERALQESERRFESVIRDSPVAIGISRLSDGVFLDVNQAFVGLYGYTREEIVGHTSVELGLWHSGNRDTVIRNLREQKGRQIVEMQARRKDGELRDVLASIDSIQLGGEPCMVGFLTDITERKQAQEVLRSQAVLLELAHDAIIVRGLGDEIKFWNRGAETTYGWTRAEAVGRVTHQLLRTSFPKPLTTLMTEVAQTGQWEGELVHLRKDGKEIVVASRWVMHSDRAGAQAGILEIDRDITERRRLEAERVAALARLAVVEEQERQRFSRELHDQTAQRLVALAVELKNLEAKLAAGRPYAKQMQLLHSTLDDLQQQVRQLAWDLRAGELAAGGLETALREYVEEWSERAEVPVDCECRGLHCDRLPLAVEATLYRVAQEALANVQRHAQARRVSVLLEREDSRVRLTVEDNGRGFDLEAVQKSPEARHRLGLLGMKERVALVGGTLLIESSPGAGTTILVRIPIPTGGKP